MKTKNLPITRTGEVKTSKATAAIAKMLQAISPNGKLQGSMYNSDNESTFVFVANGVCATFHIQNIKKGGAQ